MIKKYTKEDVELEKHNNQFAFIFLISLIFVVLLIFYLSLNHGLIQPSTCLSDEILKELIK